MPTEFTLTCVLISCSSERDFTQARPGAQHPAMRNMTFWPPLQHCPILCPALQSVWCRHKHISTWRKCLQVLHYHGGHCPAQDGLGSKDYLIIWFFFQVTLNFMFAIVDTFPSQTTHHNMLGYRTQTLPATCNRLPRKNGTEVHFEIPRWTCPRGMREGAWPSGIYWWPSSHGSGRGEGSEVRMGSRKTEDQEVKAGGGEWGRGKAEGPMGRERVAGGQDSLLASAFSALLWTQAEPAVLCASNQIPPKSGKGYDKMWAEGAFSLAFLLPACPLSFMIIFYNPIHHYLLISLLPAPLSLSLSHTLTHTCTQKWSHTGDEN